MTPRADCPDYLDCIRRFTREQLIPKEHRLEEDGGIPDEIVQKMRDIGLFAISISEEHGGLGFSMEQQVPQLTAADFIF